jgi:hypothetical protein
MNTHARPSLLPVGGLAVEAGERASVPAAVAATATMARALRVLTGILTASNLTRTIRQIDPRAGSFAA